MYAERMPTESGLLETEPTVRDALINGVVSLESMLDQTALSAYRHKTDDQEAIAAEHMLELAAIADYAGNDGFRQEIAKTVLFNIVGWAYQNGLLLGQKSVYQIPENANVQLVNNLYRRSNYGLGLTSMRLVDTPIITIDDVQTENSKNYFNTFVIAWENARLQRLREQSIAKRDVDRFEVTTREAARSDCTVYWLDQLPEALDPTDLQHFIDEQMPSYGLAVAHSIIFKSFSPAEEIVLDGEGNTSEKRAIGLYFGSGNMAININKGALKTPEDARRTVAHEIGHAVLERVSITELMQFDEARRLEPQPVSDYVDWCEKYKPEVAPMEDFCESFSLATCGDLQSISAARYAVFQALLQSHAPTA